MNYEHAQVTDGYTFREVVGTPEQIDALACSPGPIEHRAQTFGFVAAPSWKEAMMALGFEEKRIDRLGT